MNSVERSLIQVRYMLVALVQRLDLLGLDHMAAPDELRRAGSGHLPPPLSRESEGCSAALRPPRHGLQTEIVRAGPWFVQVILSA